MPATRKPGLLRRVTTAIGHSFRDGFNEAFPREANGTINWIGNPLRGDNVLGAMARGASGLDALESAGELVGIGSPDQPADAGGRQRAPFVGPPQPAVARGQGSVVARGFIGADSRGGLPSVGPRTDFQGRSPNWNRPSGLLAQVNVIPQGAGTASAREEIARGQRAVIDQAAPGRAGAGQSQARANLLGASQRFGSQFDFAEMYDAQRRRAEQER